MAKEPLREVEFHFNYRSEENEIWDNQDLRDEWRYKTEYSRAEGLTVKLA